MLTKGSCIFVLVAVLCASFSSPFVAAVKTTSIHIKKEDTTSSSSAHFDAIAAAVTALYNDVLSLQWTDDKELHLLVFWGHQKGRFQNNVHPNFNGNPIMQKLRSDLSIPDNNMFVTQFVLEALIEAGTLWPDLAPINDEGVFLPALNSSLMNRDQNYATDVPVFGFWPQQWTKAADGQYAWRQWSINMSPDLADATLINKVLALALDAIGLSGLAHDTVQLAEDAFHSLYHIFNIPADSDDTSTMLAFSRWLLKTTNNSIPLSSQLWQAQQFNYSAAIDVIVANSYCPAGPAFRNSLDSRSYYWSRFFLQNITDPEACIVATWLESVDKEAAILQGQGAGSIMPFNVNNIDPTVAANTLFGMSTALLNGHSSWLNTEGSKVYLTTAEFVAYALQTQPEQTRPDLEMLYYPPTVLLPYFVARHLKMLRDYVAEAGAFPFPQMQEVHDLLSSAMKNGGMQYLVGTQTSWCGDAPNPQEAACWDGFLGAADTDYSKSPTPHYDDRFFTTATVLNALFDAWTVTNPTTGALSWIPSTPASVQTLASGATTYLVGVYSYSNTSFMNAFFSASLKGQSCSPFVFPPNIILDLANNTQYTCTTWPNASDTSLNLFWAMLGNNVTESQYQAMLNEGCAGSPSGVNFDGFNNEFPWPFWSATVVSKAFAMNALAKALWLF